MLQTKVFKNYRTFDEKDSFKTNTICSLCEKQAEQYLLVEGWIKICKTCLTKGIEKLDKTFMEHCKTDAR